MLKIRLQRTGKKKQAHFRVVLQEHTWKTQGKYKELLGTYDPHAKKLDINRERVEHWMALGAQISPTVNNLMVNHKVWDREKLDSWKPKVKEATEEGADEPKAEGTASEEAVAEPATAEEEGAAPEEESAKELDKEPAAE